MCLEVEYIHEPDEQPCPQGRYILIWRQTMIKISKRMFFFFFFKEDVLNKKTKQGEARKCWGWGMER